MNNKVLRIINIIISTLIILFSIIVAFRIFIPRLSGASDSMRKGLLIILLFDALVIVLSVISLLTKPRIIISIAIVAASVFGTDIIPLPFDAELLIGLSLVSLIYSIFYYIITKITKAKSLVDKIKQKNKDKQTIQ